MNREIVNLLKKRVSTLKLDMRIFTISYLFVFLYSFILAGILNSIFVIALVIIFFPLFFFVLIPYITNGYTVGGYITGVRVISLSNQRNRIPFNIFFKRALKEFKFYYQKEKYSIFSDYPLIKIYLINSHGQFLYDEKLNISVRVKKINIKYQEKIKYYELEDTKKDFDAEAKHKGGIKLDMMVILFWFLIITLTSKL